MLITDKANGSSIIRGLQSSFQSQTLCDVTVKCGGKSIKCHRVVLSQSSPYFQAMFDESSMSPEVVGVMGMKFPHLEALIRFMYYGKIRLLKDEAEILRGARDLGMEALVRFASEYRKDGKDDDRLSNVTDTVRDTSAANGVDSVSSGRKRGANDFTCRSTDSISSTQNCGASGFKKMKGESDSQSNADTAVSSEAKKRNTLDTLNDTEKDEIQFISEKEKTKESVEKDRRSQLLSPKASIIVKRRDPEKDDQTSEEERRSNRATEREKEREKEKEKERENEREKEREREREKQLEKEREEKDKEKERRKGNSNPLSKPTAGVQSTPKNSDDIIHIPNEERRKSKADEEITMARKKEVDKTSNVSLVACSVCNKQYKSSLDHKKLDPIVGIDQKCNYNGCPKPVKFRRSLIDHLLREHKIDVCDG